MKKLLVVAAVLVSLGLVGSIFAGPASAFSYFGPWTPSFPSFGGANAVGCGPAWCGPVWCAPAYYCCPPPPCVKKKAAKPKTEMKPKEKKK